MGVVTKISLDELNSLFNSYNFTKIIPTTSGIIDTTYIVETKNESYILKRYERDIEDKINQDIELLKTLKKSGLNISTCRDISSDWYVYEKLKGMQPRLIKTYHIQELARFLAKFHKLTYTKNISQCFEEKDEISKALKFTKNNFFYYYKRLEFLKDYRPKIDGLIHGDIFKDNTVFDGTKLGVFDFIDSINGSFYFDIAVILVDFDAKKHAEYFINIFLNTYNQKAVKKLDKQKLISSINIASSFYALKRIHTYKNTNKAKELL